ncbi:MAG: PD-(D/E)XK nuclease family protein [Deferribacteraceae bacterium]|jgi:RecB family exonuclease|nr:PD-(D/E)XK nuclease family protein [Deferribacteraceae bacterium]
MLDMHKIPTTAKPLLYLKNLLLKENTARTAVIVPTNRNLRTLSAYAKWELDIQTISEFTRRANRYPGVLLPKELRGYYLYKAARSIDLSAVMRTKEIESYIQFIQRSSALLPFFREIMVEGIDPKRLQTESMYHDYADQIDVLSKLWATYCMQVHQDGFFDEWECFAAPELDESYISRYDRFIFLIGGYLNNYEITQLKSLSNNAHVSLYFNYVGDTHHQRKLLTSRFNAEIQTEDDEVIVANAHIIPCQSGLAQHDLITKKILETHYTHNIPFSKMAVVLPDPKLASLFTYSDPYNLYNVSSGLSVADTPLFERLNGILEIISTVDSGKIYLPALQKFAAAYPHLSAFIRKELSKGALYITADSIPSPALLTMIKPFLKATSSYSEVIAAVSIVAVNDPEAISELEKLQLIYSRIEEPAPTKELLSAVMKELSQLSTPMNKGSVAVIGLLESRNMQYDYLFLPDMNASSFPAKQGKDLFMNTELRRALELPTHADRELLLKNYYYQIIMRAKSALITYTASESEEPSPFIAEITTISKIATRERESYNPNRYLLIPNDRTFKANSGAIEKSDEILSELREFKFSATSLQLYRRCQLQFFYRHIKGLKANTEAITDYNAGVIGDILHKTMETLFKSAILPEQSDYLQHMERVFDDRIQQFDYLATDAVGRFQTQAIRNTFPLIASQERARAKVGIIKQRYEDPIAATLFGVQFEGKIDRWDLTTKGYTIIDYKYRAVKETSVQSFDKIDIQLPIYALMMEASFRNLPIEMLWFGFKGDGFVQGFPIERIEEFREYLSLLIADIFADGVFKGAERDDVCEYCPYTSFCKEALI